jgi:HEAT repeat protein
MQEPENYAMPSQPLSQAPAAATPEALRSLTYALRLPDTATAAAEALAGIHDRAAVEALVELLHAPPSAEAAIAAVAALDACDDPGDLILDGLRAALAPSYSSVRVVAIEALHRRGRGEAAEDVVRLLRQDPAWIVRRSAVRFLADTKPLQCWLMLAAADDPHWRVRHALLQVLLVWGADPSRRGEIDQRLAELSGPRPEGLHAYLHYRWTGEPPQLGPEAEAPPWPFWDWDAAVLVRNLERLGEAGRRTAMSAMPDLLGHADERVRAVALDTLRAWGDGPVLARVLLLLDEPRSDGAAAARELLAGIELDRIEETARHVLHLPAPSSAALAWALDQAGDAFPCEEEADILKALLAKASSQTPPIRRALARLAGRWQGPDGLSSLQQFLDDDDSEVQREALHALLALDPRQLDATQIHKAALSPEPLLRAEAVEAAVASKDLGATLEALVRDEAPEVRLRVAECLTRRGVRPDLLEVLRHDIHPHVRAAALTPEAAGQLVEQPQRESSWYVLSTAARLAKKPLWGLAPAKPWHPPAAPRRDDSPFQLQRPGSPPHARPITPRGMLVAPLGLSGHYGLPMDGFARALEAGVNLLFWEPGYLTLTRFAARLSAAERRSLFFLSGTFEADGKRIRRDVERALRHLGIDQLAIFLIFWVQSWSRLTPDVHETLLRLQEEGKVASFGFSTHSRPLAVEALRQGFNPVMVRHSAAHRGAEKEVFPDAARLGVPLLTFSSTCYGRLLQPRPGLTPPTAADCYRYSLEQPSVSACFCAPATLEQLAENLDVLRDPTLPEDRRGILLAQGASLYEDERVFRHLIRSR